MSRSAKVTQFFGDGPHDFALLVGQCVELQETFDCGLMPMLERVQTVDLKAIKAVLRLGLIGGGMEKQPAFLLVERECIPGALGACSMIAAKVVAVAIAGPEDEPLPGERTGERASPLSPEARSDTATSTVLEEPSASPRSRSTRARSGKSAPPSTASIEPTARKRARAPRATKSTTKS